MNRGCLQTVVLSTTKKGAVPAHTHIQGQARLSSSRLIFNTHSIKTQLLRLSAILFTTSKTEITHEPILEAQTPPHMQQSEIAGTYKWLKTYNLHCLILWYLLCCYGDKSIKDRVNAREADQEPQTFKHSVRLTWDRSRKHYTLAHTHLRFLTSNITFNHLRNNNKLQRMSVNELIQDVDEWHNARASICLQRERKAGSSAFWSEETKSYRALRWL